MIPELEQAIALRQAKDYERARQLFAQLHQDYSDDALVNYHYAWLHDAIGEETAALPYYVRAIALGLPSEELRGALLGLGSTYRAIGEYDKSVETLRRGMEEFPQAKEFPTFLAMALYNQGSYHAAVSLLLQTLVDTTDDTGIRRFERAIRLYAEDLDRTWV